MDLDKNGNPSVESSIMPEYIRTILDNVAVKEGFKDWTVDMTLGAKHGDGFMSILHRVDIKGSRMVNDILLENDNLVLLCKIPPDNEIRREQFKALLVHERECLAYEKILPAFVQFQREKGLNENNGGFFAFPKCYAAINDPANNIYAIILEDLREKGYKLWNKLNPVTFKHVKILMEKLGRYHALSYAMKDQQPEKFEQWKDLGDVMFEGMLNGMDSARFETMMDATFDRVLTSLVENDIVEKEKVQLMRKSYGDIVKSCLHPYNVSEFGVLNHGDCWNNNMLFLYNKDNEPEDISLIDWQLVKYASPVLDIVYYMFSSTEKHLRDEHYTDLIEIYYKSVTDHIKRLGSNPEKILSYDNLKEQFKLCGKYGLATAMFLLPIITAKPEDIPDIDEMAEQFNQDVNAFANLKTIDSDILYRKRMSDVIKDVIKLEYF